MDLKKFLGVAKNAIRAAVRDGVLRNGPADSSLDAALLVLTTLRFPDKELKRQTILRIHSELRMNPNEKQGSFLFRYKRKDDFGDPQSAFLICSFWLVQALEKIGLHEEAKIVMANATVAANSLGLLSEHYDSNLKLQFGNFPQAYSHVGLINAAFAISPNWSEIL